MKNQITINCPYCNKPAKLVNGTTIYPHRPDLANRRFYLCLPCDAYVGTHENGIPFGTLANKELRKMRSEAHKEFDDIWKLGALSRTKAYQRLQQYMKLSEQQCHIGMFNIQQCQQVLEFCYSFWD